MESNQRCRNELWEAERSTWRYQNSHIFPDILSAGSISVKPGQAFFFKPLSSLVGVAGEPSFQLFRRKKREESGMRFLSWFKKPHQMSGNVNV